MRITMLIKKEAISLRKGLLNSLLLIIAAIIGYSVATRYLEDTRDFK